MGLFSKLGGLAGLAGIAAAPFTGGASLALTGSSMANSATAASAEKQMKFQQYNSDTAHQREVKDLMAAGLNPMLSATGGSGASSPSGSSYTAQDEISGGLSTALQTRMVKAQVDNLVEQNSSIKSQTQLNNALGFKAKADALLSSNSAKNAADQNAIIREQAKQLGFSNKTLSHQTDANTSWMARALNHFDRFMDSAGRLNPFVSSASSAVSASKSRQPIYVNNHNY